MLFLKINVRKKQSIDVELAKKWTFKSCLTSILKDNVPERIFNTDKAGLYFRAFSYLMICLKMA